jgi:hypothetical protein
MMTAIQAQLGGYFTLGVPFVSSIINPGDSDYAKFNVKDTNTFYFTIDSQAVLAKGQIAQMEVDTDISVMPYQDILTEYFIGIL